MRIFGFDPSPSQDIVGSCPALKHVQRVSMDFVDHAYHLAHLGGHYLKAVVADPNSTVDAAALQTAEWASVKGSTSQLPTITSVGDACVVGWVWRRTVWHGLFCHRHSYNNHHRGARACL